MSMNHVRALPFCHRSSRVSRGDCGSDCRGNSTCDGSDRGMSRRRLLRGGSSGAEHSTDGMGSMPGGRLQIQTRLVPLRPLKRHCLRRLLATLHVAPPLRFLMPTLPRLRIPVSPKHMWSRCVGVRVCVLFPARTDPFKDTCSNLCILTSPARANLSPSICPTGTVSSLGS